MTPLDSAPAVLIVDGYNVAHAWTEAKAALERGLLEEARRLVVARLAAYAAVRPVRVEVVFDGPRRRQGPPSPAEVVDGVTMRFSGRAGSADAVIERLVYEAARRPGAAPVRVATGDRLQRDMVRAMGAATVDPVALDGEVEEALREIASRAIRLRSAPGRFRRVEDQLPEDVYRALERLRRGTAGEGPSDGAAGTGPPSGAGGEGAAGGCEAPPPSQGDAPAG